jgi:hypothetical protein
MEFKELKEKLVIILRNADENHCPPCSPHKVWTANSTAFLLARCGIDPIKLKLPENGFKPLKIIESDATFRWTNCFCAKELFAAIETAFTNQDAGFQD